MRFFEASIETVIWRFYAMMAVVIIPFVMGVPALALFAVPVFLSALMGVSFKQEKKEIAEKTSENNILVYKNPYTSEAA